MMSTSTSRMCGLLRWALPVLAECTELAVMFLLF